MWISPQCAQCPLSITYCEEQPVNYHKSAFYLHKIFPSRSHPKLSGPAEGEGLGGLQPPHFFGNFKELLRKRCFQPPHFESLFAPPPPPTFKVAPRALTLRSSRLIVAERKQQLYSQVSQNGNFRRISSSLF